MGSNNCHEKLGSEGTEMLSGAQEEKEQRRSGRDESKLGGKAEQRQQDFWMGSTLTARHTCRDSLGSEVAAQI